MKSMHRRSFIRQTGMLTLGAMASNSAFSKFSSEPTKKVRIGIIGVGFWGQDHLELLLKRDDVEVNAISFREFNRLVKSKNRKK